MMQIIYIIYYVFCGYLLVLCALSFIKTKNIQEEILYACLAIPFFLRILLIK
jgi:hypothetical protein